jgi:hypothetical protein
LAGSGSEIIIPDPNPDPDPAKISGSDRIRIHNTDFCKKNYIQDDENLPDKVTDVYYNLIKCLIRRERSTRGNGVIPKESPPSAATPKKNVFTGECAR